MATAHKLLFLLLVVIFVQGIHSHCELSSIQVQTTNTGATAGADPVFEVEVRNQCPCAVQSVRLNGGGFATTLNIDPSLFRDDGGSGTYLVNDGREISAGASVSFQYAWDHYFQITPASFEDQC